ncbi:MAG TPA: superoxide dismutase [Aggregatilineales bacterium]|nr:superoxide dismutase [Aggregatilineales bacterium]
MPKFELPPLPYDFAALEPHIDAQTMQIHHDKHHAAYVNNLNTALEKHADLQNKSAEDLLKGLKSLPEDIQMAVRNNGGGHVNHTMFWEIMGPKGGGEPSGALADAIKKAFGDFATFKTQLQDAGMKRFGSGWAWLVKEGSGVKIISTANQDNPLTDGLTPVLGVDVWEHAYYLKYQNRRADYLAAWWNIVNWDEVAKRFGK